MEQLQTDVLLVDLLPNLGIAYAANKVTLNMLLHLSWEWSKIERNDLDFRMALVKNLRMRRDITCKTRIFDTINDN